MELVEAKKQLEALKFLKAFRNRYPSSKRTPEVELHIGDILYDRGEYIEAVSIYDQFQQRHPTHPRLGYALLQSGKAHQQQIPRTIDRDQTHVEAALASFSKIQQDPEYGEEATGLARQMQRLLAKRQRYVADYYLKRKKWLAAEGRLRTLIDKFSFADMTEAALFDLIRVYTKTDRLNEATNTLNQLEQRSTDTARLTAARRLLEAMRQQKRETSN